MPLGRKFLLAAVVAALTMLWPKAWALAPGKRLSGYVTRTYGVEDGLPQPFVSMLAQTPDG